MTQVWIVALLFLLLGLALGATVAWLVRGLRAARGGAELARQLEQRAGEFMQKINLLTGQLHGREAEAARVPALENELRALRERLGQETEKLARLETTLAGERQAIEEQKALLAGDQSRLINAFKALSADALKQNNASFLQLAGEKFGTTQQAASGDLEKRQQAIGEMVTPLREQLGRYEKQIKEMEDLRMRAHGELLQQMKMLDETHNRLKSETESLATALRRPEIRGSWGEATLRRVAELAGMVNYCDFCEQVSVEGEQGRLRADMVVRLPGGAQVIVDAKAPLTAYLEAQQAADSVLRRDCLERYAGHMRGHVEQLAKKAYWEQFDPAPDFVVMFIPGEHFLTAALDLRADLLEFGFGKKVVLATPTTLIALLRTVALGWRQEQLAANALKVSELGSALYERLSTMAAHLDRLGKAIRGGVTHYNALIGSLERSVLPAARRFPELGITVNKELAESLEMIDQMPTIAAAPELLPLTESFVTQPSE